MVERKNRPIDLDPSQRFGLTSVTLTCRDCDFKVTGDIVVYDGWKAVRDQSIIDCQEHHEGRTFHHTKHNRFKILLASEQMIGGLSVSGETRAQVYIYEDAKPFLQNLGGD